MARSDTPRRPTSELAKSAPDADLSLPEPEILNSASEALRPFLRDANQAPTAALQVVSAIHLHRGPLPAPELLGGYDEILPGAAREIMDMALREQRHRHAIERAESRYPFVGMAAGFVAFLLCMAGAIYLGMIGQPIIAALLVGTPLVGAIGWFINGRVQLRQASPAPVVPSSKRKQR